MTRRRVAARLARAVSLRNARWVRWSRRAGLTGGLVGVACLVGAPAAMAAPAFSSVARSALATGTNPYSVAFSPDGSLLATADGGPHMVSVFRARPPAC